MTRWLTLLLLLLVHPATAAPDYRALNEAVVQRHILPRYAALVQATEALDHTAERCTDTAGLREKWRGAVLAWEGAQHLRFGPALLFSRNQRFQFWPDPRNATQRQLADLFQKGVLPNFITGSIAVQGLSALERELFDPAAAAKLGEPFRCQWLRAVTANLAGMAREIVSDWGRGRDYARQFVAAQGPDVSYADSSEATLDLFKSLYSTVEQVSDQKLARPLGKNAREARPTAAEWPRSGASGAAIAANLLAAKDMGALFAPYLPAALATDLDNRLADLVRQAEHLDVEKSVADTAKRPATEKLRAAAFETKTLLAEKVTVALGIPLGFNALDGD
jgi:predicted lipoprotein